MKNSKKKPLKENQVQVSMSLDRELKEFMGRDAARCGLTVREYFERLLRRRKEEAPEIINYNV